MRENANVSIARALSVEEFASEFGAGHATGGNVTLKSGKTCGCVKAGNTVALATSEEAYAALQAGRLSQIQCVLVDDKDYSTQYWRLCMHNNGIQNEFTVL